MLDSILYQGFDLFLAELTDLFLVYLTLLIYGWIGCEASNDVTFLLNFYGYVSGRGLF